MLTYFRLLRYIKPHVSVFGMATVCMVGSTLLNGVQTGMLIPLIDRLASNHPVTVPPGLPEWVAGLVGWVNSIPPRTLLNGFALAIPVLFLLKGVFDFLQTFYMGDVSQRVIRDLRQEMFNKFTSLSLDYHHKSQTGSTMSRILYDTGTVQNSISEGVTDLIYQSLQIVLYLSIVFSLHWKLALLTFIVIPLIGFCTLRVGKFLKKLSHQAQTLMGQLSTTILESISGIQVIQAFLMEQSARIKFAAANQRFYRVNRKTQKRMEALTPVTDLLGAAGAAIVFWVGGGAVLSNELTLGAFTTFLWAMMSLIRPFKRLARLHSINQQALAAANRIFEVLDTEPSITEQPKAKTLPIFHREIVYDKVSFQYDRQAVLRNISLTIPKGDILALVGPSGGGKTTFANLLPRFYDPTAGRLLIDGVDVRHVTLNSLRSQIGLVTQETMLFDDTVRGNLAIGNPAASFADIVDAAKAANAHEFISRLPKGYDTLVGERGQLLSGGERQRLAVARAILKNPPILILDEATSQLDAESEHLITDALERLCQGRTVLLIAHRLSTVRLAHRIAVIQEGRVVEQGTHEELLKHSPIYRRFCELQTLDTGLGGEPSGVASGRG